MQFLCITFNDQNCHIIQEGLKMSLGVSGQHKKVNYT
jgi:hypothetical protein